MWQVLVHDFLYPEESVIVAVFKDLAEAFDFVDKIKYLMISASITIQNGGKIE